MVDVAEDDHARLLRLLSLVFETGGKGVGIRFADQQQRLEWFDRGKATVERMDAALKRGAPIEEADDPEWGHFPADFHLAGSYFKDALKFRSGDNRYEQNSRELPMFVLEAVGQVTDTAHAMLGRIVLRALRLREVADSRRLAQLWLDDVTATSWSLLLKYSNTGINHRILNQPGGDQ